MYAASLLREHAERLDINGMFASKSAVRVAIALPLLLAMAFAILLTLQLL
jgi:hypothetical protein